MKERVDHIVESKQLTQRDIERYYAEHRMDLFEECSDVLFEYQIYRAALKGVIREEQIRGWLPELEAIKAKKLPFVVVRSYIRNHLSEGQFRRFHEMIGSVERSLSDEFLVISCLKHAQFALRGNSNNLIQDVQDKLDGETEEFVDALDHKPWFRRLMNVYLRLTPFLQPLSGRNLMWPPIQATRWVTGMSSLKEDDLIRFMIIKQSGRQELEHHSLFSYNERKMILKPFEALIEAHMIRQLEEPEQTILPLKIP